MVEWSNTAVLKTADVKASGGSNPSLCAKRKHHQTRWCFYLYRIRCCFFNYYEQFRNRLKKVFKIFTHWWKEILKFEKNK